MLLPIYHNVISVLVGKMIPEQAVQLKKILRTQLVRVVDALTLNEITTTLRDERRLQTLLSEVVRSTALKFEGADISDVQYLLFSIVGDMPKCAIDLRADLPEDIQKEISSYVLLKTVA
ncbi:hypothetical protein GOP47_0005528 [Adiantum capillus-veneris]|uniref:Uncharacterized protein n=1 Tax=Adiantum capillus-veneris TaxID=13818 RepID=A0A9D4ZLN6_ADICA|nr:hypothetical protein GOP47_0005528 [Adiantum capillus-veneris]